MSSNHVDNQQRFPGQSPIPMSCIPPPPILFHSYSVPNTPNGHPTGSNNASSVPNSSPCCSVEAGKREIQTLIDNFMRDLDGAIASNFSVQDQPAPSNQSQQDCEQDSEYPRSCVRCRKRAKGLPYYCSLCGVDVVRYLPSFVPTLGEHCFQCLSCHFAVGRNKCPTNIYSCHVLMRHPRVPVSFAKLKPTIRTPRSYPHSTIMSPLRATRRFEMLASRSAASTMTFDGPSFQGTRQPEGTPSSSQPQHSNNLNMSEGVSGVAHSAVCDLCDSGIRGHRYVSLTLLSGITLILWIFRNALSAQILILAPIALG